MPPAWAACGGCSGGMTQGQEVEMIAGHALMREGRSSLARKRGGVAHGRGTRSYRAWSIALVIGLVGLSAQTARASALYTWGENFFGQVGDGTTTDRYVPTAIT